MPIAPPRRATRLATTLRLALAGATVAAVAVTSLAAGPQGAVAPGIANVDGTTTPANPVTPGNFTGFAFDQCLAPSQSTMDAWLQSSPYLGVGIYISGRSRACRSQPNLTPTWIRTQLAKGWRLLPITMGPQASCQPRFPRYRDDFRISAVPGNGSYDTARRQARATATQTVTDAQALGIASGSTLWYDLEGFDVNNNPCRQSALAFLSAWTNQIHALGFVSGVYSSAGSGIAALDTVRIKRPGVYTMPDRIWLARWDGVANTSTSYIREDGWRPGGRVKQYQGGHDETWGGVRINVDRDYLDLGTGSTAPAESHCGGVPVTFAKYVSLQATAKSATPAPPAQVKALECLLTERQAYQGKLDGTYSSGLANAVKAWQAARGFPVDPAGRWYRRDWMSLLSFGSYPVQKAGSAGTIVRRIQRTLNATGRGYRLANTGVYDAATLAAVRSYQQRVGIPVTGVVGTATWVRLIRGQR